ncbi:MAG: hypothetical protein QOI74_3525, partial [Micromonosporaceae bacterium]|nr:hypothetical protein [Micromonosporaceae bacterium]
PPCNTTTTASPRRSSRYSTRPDDRQATSVGRTSSDIDVPPNFYASALLDAGENVKALATYLGHTDPAFTLRVYTHLMPSSEDRARHAIDALFEVAGSAADALATP